MPYLKKDLSARFSELPPEVLFTVLDKLPPEELTPNLLNLNRELRVKVSAIWQNLWKNKLARHFPHVYKTLPLRKKREWYSEFQKTYQHEYQCLPAFERKLFSLTKENDIESLAKTGLDFSNLHEEKRFADINGKRLLKWLQEINNKEVLNYFFSHAKQRYEKIKEIRRKNFSATEFEFYFLINQAIAYHQNCDQIMYLMANKEWLNEKCELGSELRNGIIRYRGEFLLEKAAVNGHLQLVHYLLKIQTEMGLKPLADRSKVLFKAVTEGFSEVALALIKAGLQAPEMESNSFNLAFPFLEAISKDFLPVVKAFINTNPELLKADSSGYTPLMHAVHEGKLSIVEYLLTQKGIDVEATMNHRDYGRGVTALYIAAKKRNAEIVRKLLLGGAAGDKACEGDRRPENFFYSAPHSKMPPLHLAIDKGDLETVKAFIETQPELLNLTAGRSKISPLMLAVEKNNLEITEYLLDQKGIMVEARALQLAVERENLAMGKPLLENHPTQLHASGIIVEARALELAVKSENLAMVKLLLENQPTLLHASREQEDPYQLTPLMHAAISGNLPIVQYLLKQEGIELLARYGDRTALHLAEETVVFTTLLAAHVKANLPLETSKMSSAAQKNPKVLLLDYLAKRESEPNYNPSFLFFRLPFKWGFSKKEKLAAAEALKAVMFENKSIETLDSHKGALNNGRLKGIYHKYLATRELIFADNSRSQP